MWGLWTLGRTDAFARRRCQSECCPCRVFPHLCEGGSVAVADKYGETPLHIAAGFGSAASVEAILSAGADMEAQTVYGWTPLHAAAWHGNPEAVRVFLGAGAKRGARVFLGGKTPLVFEASPAVFLMGERSATASCSKSPGTIASPT